MTRQTAAAQIVIRPVILFPEARTDLQVPVITRIHQRFLQSHSQADAVVIIDDPHIVGRVLQRLHKGRNQLRIVLDLVLELQARQKTPDAKMH